MNMFLLLSDSLVELWKHLSLDLLSRLCSSISVLFHDFFLYSSSTGPTVSKASLSHSVVTLPCPPIYGDYVRLYWWRAKKPAEPELIFQFNRWRNRTKQKKSDLQLIVPSPSAGGNFSFLLQSALLNAGRYQCEVFLDDTALGQSTTLTVLHGNGKQHYDWETWPKSSFCSLHCLLAN